MAELDYRTVPLTDTLDDRARGWAEAMMLGFLGKRFSDDGVAKWHADLARDEWRLTGVFAGTESYGLGEHVPVATFATTTQSINTGGGHLEPALFVTDVTVRATHRRRGILTRLMTDALAQAKADGLALAALTVSEGGIYGRFGFGVATTYTKAELDTSQRLAFSHLIEPRVELLAPERFVEVHADVFARFHAHHRGSHVRLPFVGTALSGEYDYETDGPHRGYRHAVHVDPAGRPDGLAVWEANEEKHELAIRDVLALNPEAELGLYQFLAGIDLVEKATIRRLAPLSPLEWALVDPRRLTITGVGDYTWLRILDVPRALGVRAFDADGEASFTLVDPLGHTAGDWQLVVRDGRADVTPAASAPALELEVNALANLYFGLADARALAAAGRLTGPAEEVAALATLFRTVDPAHNVAGF